jgi:hypothetical protein
VRRRRNLYFGKVSVCGDAGEVAIVEAVLAVLDPL